MKKIILVALSAVVAFSLCGCTVMESLGFKIPAETKTKTKPKTKPEPKSHVDRMYDYDIN